MKTKEFIRRVEELGYFVNKSLDYYEIKDVDKDFIAVINRTIFLQLNTDYCGWDELCEMDKKELFDLLVEYAKTPLKERKSEKKYYLKHKFMKALYGSLYLNCRSDAERYFVDDKTEADSYKTQFTEKEIEEIEAKGFDLRNFERIEVEE